jgi:predicted dehydrogenase
MAMKWAVVGCGVIGERRASALPKGSSLVACFDTNQERSKAFSAKTGAVVKSSLDELLKSEADIVIVSTINAALAPTLQLALRSGKAVLVEKPGARGIDELVAVDNSGNIPVKVGFNHRFHPAYADLLKELQSNSKDDPVMYIRARYGNGARLGFDREWRSKVELSGGGELLDQGVHVLDLALQIIPELKVTGALVRTQYWDMNVDDNAWALLSSPMGQSFSMHVSSSEWKNEFQFDVYTRRCRYTWRGLGRSYGPETLAIYRMKPEMGPPDEEIRQYSAQDNSWLEENAHFEKALNEKSTPWGNLEDAKKCLTLVESIYKTSHEQQGFSEDHPQWWSKLHKL